MKLQIDSTLCVGHGRCSAVASSLFHADDEGFGVVNDVPFDESHRLEAEAAIAVCPERAISLVEE